MGTFSVDEITRLVVKDSKTGHSKLGKLTDFAVGDSIYPDFWIDPIPKRTDASVQAEEYLFSWSISLPKATGRTYPPFSPAHYQGKVNKAVRICNFQVKELRNHSAQMTFWGEISSKDIDQKTIEVRMPTPKPDEIYGYRFWKQDKDIADPSRTNEEGSLTATKVKAVTRWVEGPDEARLYRFCIDDAVRIIRNGEVEQSFEDLQIGDKVSVFYLPFYEEQHQGKTLIYPEVILSSTALACHVFEERHKR